MSDLCETFFRDCLDWFEAELADECDPVTRESLVSCICTCELRLADLRAREMPA